MMVEYPYCFRIVKENFVDFGYFENPHYRQLAEENVLFKMENASVDSNVFRRVRKKFRSWWSPRLSRLL